MHYSISNMLHDSIILIHLDWIYGLYGSKYAKVSCKSNQACNIFGLLQCNQQHQNNWKNPFYTNGVGI